MTDHPPEYRPDPPPAPWQVPPPASWQTPPPPPGAVPAQRRRRGLAVGALVAAVLIAGAAVGVTVGLVTRGSPPATSGGNARTPNPTVTQARTLFQQALAATRNSAGVHYVARSDAAKVTQNTLGDATQEGGSQLITLNSTYGNELFTLRLVSGTVYFNGNTPALEDQLGVPAAGAPAVQDKWVSVSSSDGPYIVLQPGITVADQALSVAEPVTGLAFVPTSMTQVTTADGTRATRILGTVSQQRGTAHVDIAPDSHLPIAEASTLAVPGGGTDTSTVTFSGWGTVASVTAPSTVVAWPTLGASEPPGGYGSGGISPGGSGQTPSAATPGL
jgi:hypothetical protein